MPKSSFQLVISALTQLVMIVVLLLGSHAQAQEVVWVKTYGGYGSDRAWGSCPTADGGFVLVGFTTVYGYDIQIYMVKTDSKGDTLWTRVYGGYGWDQANSVQPTADGGYVMAGWGDSYGNAVQAYLIKTNSRGDTLWFRTYGGVDLDDAISVQQTSDGGYIFVGSTHSYGAGHWDVYLVKTDSTGVPEWTRVYGGVTDDRGAWVEQTTDGGYIVTGYTESFAPHRGVYLLKTDSEGDTLWTRVYYPWYSDWNHGFCCQQSEDGGYIVSGYSVDNTTGNCYFSLIKTDPEGDTLWTRTYGGFFLAWGRSVRQTHDGGYIVAGHLQSYESGYQNDIYIVKTDQEGDTLWTRSFGGTEGDVAVDVQQTSDGSYIVVGATGSHGAGSSDVYLLKISSSLMPTLRGDANGDGVINVSDVVYLINYVLKGGPTPEPLKAGDANCDLWIDLEDVIYLIRYLFLGGPEPGLGCDKAGN
ncbi:MAG: hypothetical protein GTO24_27725 [candidate division Zixibacteria bacterium]|nr:hypothetical protein [candidate division Zixibacteria bacterium]